MNPIRSSAVFCSIFTILGFVVGRFFHLLSSSDHQSESGSADSGKQTLLEEEEEEEEVGTAGNAAAQNRLRQIQNIRFS